MTAIADKGSMLSPDWLGLLFIAAALAYTVVVTWIAVTIERERHPQPTHTCTGCYDATVTVCGDLCVDCTFDAEQATGRAWPAIEERLRGDRT